MLRIGVDLGGTKTEAIALDDAGRELRRLRVPTVKGDYAATLRNVTNLVGAIETELAEAGTVGVAIPGTLVAASGLVKNANSTWLNGRPLAADLSRALQREIRCANDANCFAVSEAADGAGRGAHVVFGVIVGTGCGGSVAIGGAAHVGLNGLAGEWGHIPLPWPTPEETPGPACYCGRVGCVETWISGTGFEADYARHAGQSARGSEIVARLREGDQIAMAPFARLRDRLARGLVLVVNLLDPDVIVLGGGLSNIDELYSGELEDQMAQYAFGGGTVTRVVRNVHGDASGVRGAAWLWPRG